MTAVDITNLDEYQNYIRRLSMTTNVDRGCAWCRDDETAGAFTWCFCREDCGFKHCPVKEDQFAMPPVPQFREAA